MKDPLTNATKGAEGTKHVSEGQADLVRRLRRSGNTGSLITSIPKWAAYAIIAWQAAISIEAMTGKTGLASLLERFGRQASYWEVVCWVAGLLGILFGLYSRHLLRKHVARDAARLDALERRLFENLGTGPAVVQGTTDSAQRQ
jgi:hypothetical protein